MPDQLLDGTDAGDDVGVRDLDALGRARRTGRVHDARDVVGLGQVALVRVLLAELGKLFERVDLQVIAAVRLDLVEGAFGDVLGAAVVDDQLERRRLGEGVCEGAEKRSLSEDTVHLGLVDRMLQAFLAERVVSGRKGDALLGACCGQGVRVSLEAASPDLVKTQVKTDRSP